MIKKRSLSLVILIASACSLPSLHARKHDKKNNSDLSPKEETGMINIDLHEKQRNQVAGMLHATLADEYTLYTKTLNYHWNVQGMHFNDLHLFFGKQYEQLSGFVDGVAERTRALGIYAKGSMTEFLQHTRLQENISSHLSDKEMIADLLNDHETIIRSLRKDVQATAELNDMGTNNFLTDLMMKHEKMAWMLRAFLGK